MYDLENDSLIKTFNKKEISTVQLGWYLPGEGKLYKIAPVMQEGGTFVTDEDCGSFEFDCKGEVNNDGHDLNIKAGTTINFKNDSARIVMTAGEFTSGITPLEESAPVYLKGDGNSWKGLILQQCDVEMDKTYFRDIVPYHLDSSYAADIINCPGVMITGCNFISQTSANAGAIRITYTSVSRTPDVYLYGNYVKMDEGDVSAVSIISTGAITFPLIIEENIFESQTGASFNALLLSGVTGGAIKENVITGYVNGIMQISSALDYYANVMDGGDDDSRGIQLYAVSSANLSPDFGYYAGGLNQIASEGENAVCLEVDNSFFYSDNGYNTFNLKNYDLGNSYHFFGTIEDAFYEEFGGQADASFNCFQISGTDTDAVHSVTSMNQDPFDFNFDPYYCGDNEPEGMIVFNLGNEMYDSIYAVSYGSGGGFSNYPRLKDAVGQELSMYNVQLEGEVEIISVSSLNDSVSLNLRKRNYERVSALCIELLTDHIDSLSDVSILTKYYLAELNLDSSGSRISNLKSFLESLILDHPEKESFVKQLFYLIQKCKISLGQYESAMTGLQQIINQNPYSYEGLVASWDFSAASLLLNSNGGSGDTENLWDSEDILG